MITCLNSQTLNMIPYFLYDITYDNIQNSLKQIDLGAQTQLPSATAQYPVTDSRVADLTYKYTTAFIYKGLQLHGI
jgi:hypothetical protein